MQLDSWRKRLIGLWTRHVGRPEMVVYSTNEDPEVKKRAVGTIAMCTRDSIKAPTAMSWLMTDYSFMGPYEYVARHIVQGHILIAQRNECVSRMEGNWILFIDDDMVWQPGAVKTLIDTREKFDLDMVGGLCFQRNEPYQPTLYYAARDGGTGYTFAETWPEDTAVEVDATGMAFMLIHRRVFDRILGEPLPTKAERLRLPPPPFFKWGEYGEDLMFCREARAAGCRIFVDTSVKIGHIGEHTITEQDFYRQLAFRPPETIEKRREQLASLNLPIVTPEEAREKIRWE